jgi:hypothetical protein
MNDKVFYERLMDDLQPLMFGEWQNVDASTSDNLKSWLSLVPTESKDGYHAALGGVDHKFAVRLTGNLKAVGYRRNTREGPVKPEKGVFGKEQRRLAERGWKRDMWRVKSMNLDHWDNPDPAMQRKVNVQLSNGSETILLWGKKGIERVGAAASLLLLELVHHVRRQVIDHEVDRSLPELEAAHGVVGNDLQDQSAVDGSAAEILLEGLEHDFIVDVVADELVGAGADRMGAEVRRCAGRDKRRRHELDRKGAERLLQREFDSVVVQRPHRLQDLEGALEGGDERGVQILAVVVDDVLRGELVAVMKRHAAAKRHDVGERIGIIEPLGQRRLDAKVVADVHQRAEDKLPDALRCLVVGKPRVKIVGGGSNADDYRARRG